MVATALRSFEEWDKHPQAEAIRGIPPVTVVKVGDAPKRKSNGNYATPLEGVRVLDLTRVLAGPVCGRTLAAYGAEVLLITSPKLPDLPNIDVETSRGKRTAQVDLTSADDRASLHSLVHEADVFLQAYRPGGLRDKGFGVEDLVKEKPGIVYASLCAYGWEGPWKNRRGVGVLPQFLQTNIHDVLSVRFIDPGGNGPQCRGGRSIRRLPSSRSKFSSTAESVPNASSRSCRWISSCIWYQHSAV